MRQLNYSINKSVDIVDIVEIITLISSVIQEW